MYIICIWLRRTCTTSTTPRLLQSWGPSSPSPDQDQHFLLYLLLTWSGMKLHSFPPSAQVPCHSCRSPQGFLTFTFVELQFKRFAHPDKRYQSIYSTCVNLCFQHLPFLFGHFSWDFQLDLLSSFTARNFVLEMICDLWNCVSVPHHQTDFCFSFMDIWVRLDGAARQRSPLFPFEHHREEILRLFSLQLKDLRAASCEVNHGLTGGAALQSFVGAVQLGVSFF